MITLVTLQNQYKIHYKINIQIGYTLQCYIKKQLCVKLNTIKLKTTRLFVIIS